MQSVFRLVTFFLHCTLGETRFVPPPIPALTSALPVRIPTQSSRLYDQPLSNKCQWFKKKFCSGSGSNLLTAQQILLEIFSIDLSAVLYVYSLCYSQSLHPPAAWSGWRLLTCHECTSRSYCLITEVLFPQLLCAFFTLSSSVGNFIWCQLSVFRQRYRFSNDALVCSLWVFLQNQLHLYA